jgi:hypothetical protein
MRLLPVGVALWVAGLGLTVFGLVTQHVAEGHHRLVYTLTQLGSIVTIAAFAALLAAPRTASAAAQVVQAVVAVAVLAADTVAVVQIYRDRQLSSFEWNELAFALAVAAAALAPVVRPVPRGVGGRVGVTLAAGVCAALAYGLWKYDSRGSAWVEIAFGGAFLLVAVGFSLWRSGADASSR